MQVWRGRGAGRHSLSLDTSAGQQDHGSWSSGRAVLGTLTSLCVHSTAVLARAEGKRTSLALDSSAGQQDRWSCLSNGRTFDLTHLSFSTALQLITYHLGSGGPRSDSHFATEGTFNPAVGCVLASKPAPLKTASPPSRSCRPEDARWRATSSSSSQPRPSARTTIAAGGRTRNSGATTSRTATDRVP